MKKIIIANWKMNPDSVERAGHIAVWVESSFQNSKNIDVVLAPPFVFLESVGSVIKKVKLGAQNTFFGDTGPHTGEVSWRQLKNFGVEYVILGHSEQRALGETNEEVNKKIKTVLENGMIAVLCVGETEKNKEIAFPAIIQTQLTEGLKNIKKNFLKNLIIVYEPVWAISTHGKADNPKNVFEMSVLIRKELLKKFGKKVAFDTKILYGGSVDEKNAADFVSIGKVDGLLVGKASLNAKKFSEIVKLVSKL
ncbi:MAG TPA: triose-phosphate isomerase [Candidatus Paceibacterota bacterium]